MAILDTVTELMGQAKLQLGVVFGLCLVMWIMLLIEYADAAVMTYGIVPRTAAGKTWRSWAALLLCLCS